jgi:hypothetical protein
MHAASRAARSRWLRPVSLVLFFGLLLVASVAPAQDLIRVEEDWEMVLGEPDYNSCGPQVACTMSPFGDIDSTHFTLEINHRSMPYWSPGGITLHHWSGEWRLQSMERQDRSVMQTNGEVVRWTQSLDATVPGYLIFQITDGTSSTWGPFGYSMNLKLSTVWLAGHINNYSPDVSVSRSGVAFAGNRVSSLKILRIRAMLSDHSTATDDTVRVVHQHPAP